METPQRRQRSWLSSLTGLVSGSRPSAQSASGMIASNNSDTLVTNGDAFSSRYRSAQAEHATPSRYSGTFSAPAVESPESPVKRASPTLMAQRKIHERAQGPSGRVGASSTHATSARAENTRGFHSGSFDSHLSATPKRTNFSSTITHRNMFRNSISREVPAFTFTPRVPPNTMRASFPAATPGPSHRASGIELGGREMAKTTSSELFALKIPDPDSKLSGEAIAGMVPKDLQSGSRSVYANEYLAHLCPPEFNEEQRNQFFCILDLRRLKYAADEVFVKKDWRLNILNFAKEYEKNRSLIMLRYGLYEFKTVKVSKDVFQKWKADNNIPDLEEEEETGGITTRNSATLSESVGGVKALKLNGTEGILRTEKRKAQDFIDLPATSSSSLASTTNKRSRPLESSKAGRVTDREPLSEPSTPELNKSKRKTTHNTDAEQLRRSKLQKATPNASNATTSATRALFEKFANLPEKAPAAAETPFIHVSKPFEESSSAPKSSPFKLGTTGLSKSSCNSLARSVLESGLKRNSVQSSANIFGYLSDASSANGSGNDNADAGAEDTDESDGQDESEAQVASESTSAATNGITTSTKTGTFIFSAKPTGLLPGTAGAQGGSSASSEASETAPGRSLFDRVNKNSDGQPIRVFTSDNSGLSFGTPDLGAKPPSERPKMEKEAALFGGNKTWSPDTPIKFVPSSSSSSAKPLFGASVTIGDPVSAASLFGATPKEIPEETAKEIKSSASTFLFSSTAATKETEADTSAALFGSAVTPKDHDALCGSAAALPSASKDAAELASTAPAPTGGALNAASVFGFSSEQAGLSTTAAKPLFGSSISELEPPAASLFGKPQEQAAGTSAPSLFGASASTVKPAPPGSILQSQTLFGGAPKPETQLQGLKRTADGKESLSTAVTPSASTSVFGSALKNDSPSNNNESQAKKSMFGDPAAPSLAPSAAPIFSFGSTKTNMVNEAAKPSGEVVTAKPLFGLNSSSGTAEPPMAPASSLFGNTATPPTTSATNSIFSFGNNAANTNGTPSSFSLGVSLMKPAQGNSAGPAPVPLFGSGNTVSAPSSFTFSMEGDSGGQGFRNPFSSSGYGSQPAPSLSFGASQPATLSSSPFQFGAAAPSAALPTSGSLSFTFGAGSQPSGQQAASAVPASIFGATPTSGGANRASSIFSFGGGAQAQPSSSAQIFGQQPAPASSGSMFNLPPPVGGTSTGTNTPFTNLGGASSLASTPATGTPEPGAAQDNSDHNGHQADGDEAPQEQINLTEGGPGEEDEAVAYEVRAKAMKLVSAKDEDGASPAAKDKKSPWKTEGVGALRFLKHKTTGAIRLLLRAEPRGNVALNRALLPDFNYKPEPNAKYVKLTTSNEAGTGLETWMLQVKTKEAALKLAVALEEHKLANKK